MRLLVLADEGLNGNIVRELRESGFKVDWILEVEPGMDDERIIELAKEQQRVLITEDKDFGEWVFAHQIEGLTIIFLRYEKEDYLKVLKYLLELLKELDELSPRKENEFITINRNKVRRRRI